MSKLQGEPPSRSVKNRDDHKVVLGALTAFTGSAAGLAGILTAGDIQAAATIVALAIFGVLGIGALIVGAIYLLR